MSTSPPIGAAISRFDLQYADLTARVRGCTCQPRSSAGMAACPLVCLRSGALAGCSPSMWPMRPCSLPLICRFYPLQRLKGEVDLRSITGGHAISLRQMFPEPAHGPVLRQKLLTP